MRGLYAIVDLEALSARGIDPRAFAERVLGAEPAVLQLRAKLASARDTLAIAKELSSLCHNADVPFFVNDRVDLALLCRADGVHVGQEDLPIEEIRRIAPALRIGLSSHSEAELARALEQRPDYVAYGPIYATASKPRASPVVGIEGLGRASELARSAGLPLCAIGGIDCGRARAVAEHAALGAVIAALLPESGEGLEVVTERARALHQELGGRSA